MEPVRTPEHPPGCAVERVCCLIKVNKEKVMLHSGASGPLTPERGAKADLGHSE